MDNLKYKVMEFKLSEETKKSLRSMLISQPQGRTNHDPVIAEIERIIANQEQPFCEWVRPDGHTMFYPLFCFVKWMRNQMNASRSIAVGEEKREAIEIEIDRYTLANVWTTASTNKLIDKIIKIITE